MSSYKYTDIIFEIKGQIGIIKLNRPKALNTFGGVLIKDVVNALRELNEHPTTIFTVLTGEGRFFSAGADIRGNAMQEYNSLSPADKKLAFLNGHAEWQEVMRSIIDHSKIFVLALNGPAVGGGAAWFPALSDLVFASSDCYFMVPFSSLGLVPEMGSAVSFAQTMGVQRANEFLMFGRKIDVKEMKDAGIVNRIFEKEGFLERVIGVLEEELGRNDGGSMVEVKRLGNRRLRDGRLLAVVDAIDALGERFVKGVPYRRFEMKRLELEEKSKARGSKI